MPGQDDKEQIRKQSEQAQDYFSKIAGFEPARTSVPAPPPAPAPEEAESPPVAPRPEAPLSEAEQYFKKLLG